MTAPAPVQWIRIIGYGLTALLVALAIAVLMAPAHDRGGAPRTGAKGSPGPARSPGSTHAGANPGPAPSSGRAVDPQDTTNPPGGGQERCAPSFATYDRTGNVVKVKVRKPAAGILSAYIQQTGQTSPQTQIYQSDGKAAEHVFEFTNAPARTTQKISVGLISRGGGIQECVLSV